MFKFFLIAGAISAGLSVALGAFGAHGLKKIADPETVNIYQTGVQYQIYHALALLLIAAVADKIAGRSLNYAGYFFLGGILLFSGSLYLITALKTAEKTVPALVGVLTPIGGLLFILGWIMLLVAAFKFK